MVTHNIEEAVLMCDRALLLASNPGRIAAEIPIPLAQPRDRLDDEFRNIVDEIYSALTARTIASIGALRQLHGGMVQPLPQASVNQISGLIETLAAQPYEGSAELARLASSLSLEVDDLFPIAEALHILEFAELKDRALKLTAAGRVFAQSSTEERKRLFWEHLLRFVPLTAHICRVLGERHDHRAHRIRFQVELEDHLTRREAERTLRDRLGALRRTDRLRRQGAHVLQRCRGLISARCSSSAIFAAAARGRFDLDQCTGAASAVFYAEASFR
jgi:NitT/TauT family transport system ATP-binding protein